MIRNLNILGLFLFKFSNVSSQINNDKYRTLILGDIFNIRIYWQIEGLSPTFLQGY